MMLYLAYGSNINIRRMAKRCPTAKVMGSTILKGYQLLFRGTKGSVKATIVKRANCKVPVLIWKLKVADQLSLDRYEGYPRSYRKKYLHVMLKGKHIKAKAYIMNGNMPPGKPSHHYFDLIQKGYKTARLNIGKLNQAVRLSTSKK